MIRNLARINEIRYFNSVICLTADELHEELGERWESGRETRRVSGEAEYYRISNISVNYCCLETKDES